MNEKKQFPRTLVEAIKYFAGSASGARFRCIDALAAWRKVSSLRIDASLFYSKTPRVDLRGLSKA